MTERYDGYCFDQMGRYSRSVSLSTPEEVFEFCERNKDSHHEIRIVAPSDDATIVKVENGKYVFPEPWKSFNEGGDGPL
jgi:hypothetical protein